MKTKLILVTAKSVELAVFSLAIAGVLISIINLCTGNFGSTASFEP